MLDIEYAWEFDENDVRDVIKAFKKVHMYANDSLFCNYLFSTSKDKQK